MQKDRSLKTQILAVNSASSENDKPSGERIWSFFEMREAILECLNYNILKIFRFVLIRLTKQFKRVKILLFSLTDRFILGQAIPATNVLKNIESYKCAANKVKLIRPF